MVRLNNHLFYFLIFILVGLFSRCNNTVQDFNVKEKKFNIVNNIERLDSCILDENFYISYWKLDQNKVYIFSMRNRNPLLFVYDFPSFNLLYTYGRIGEGVEEFITVNWAKTDQENEIYLYEMMRNSLYGYKVTDSTLIREKTFPLYGETEEDFLPKPFTMINQINDSVFLLKTEMPDNSYKEIADLKNQIIYSSTPGIIKRKERIAYTPYNYEIVNKDKYIICAYNYIDRIEIFEMQEHYQLDLICIIGEKVILPPSLDKPFEEWTSYYTDIKYDDNYFYAVCQHVKDGEEYSAIEIFTFEGQPVRKIYLDQYVKSILLSPDSRIVYAYNPNLDENIIFSYEIP